MSEFVRPRRELTRGSTGSPQWAGSAVGTALVGVDIAASLHAKRASADPIFTPVSGFPWRLAECALAGGSLPRRQRASLLTRDRPGALHCSLSRGRLPLEDHRARTTHRA